VAPVLKKEASDMEALLRGIGRVLPARIALGRGPKSEEQGA